MGALEGAAVAAALAPVPLGLTLELKLLLLFVVGRRPLMREMRPVGGVGGRLRMDLPAREMVTADEEGGPEAEGTADMSSVGALCVSDQIWGSSYC